MPLHFTGCVNEGEEILTSTRNMKIPPGAFHILALGMSIRNCRPEDLEKITEFRRMGSRHSFGGKIDTSIFRKRSLEQLEKDPGSAKVLEDDGKVVGYTWFTTKKTIDGQFGVINHTFLEEACRGEGFGRKLTEAGEDFFMKRGISRVRITVSKDNRRSLAFCRKLGFKEKHIILKKRI